MSLSEPKFRRWIDAYGGAWEARDGGRFGALFDEDAVYYWTPFEDPLKGRDAIASGFSKAVCRQRDIDFGARILYVQASLGAAHWSCSYTRAGTAKRVHIDGIFVVQFGERGKALSFREWWHSDE